MISLLAMVLLATPSARCASSAPSAEALAACVADASATAAEKRAAVERARAALTPLVRAAVAGQPKWFASLDANGCALGDDGVIRCMASGPCEGACRHATGRVELRLDGGRWKATAFVKGIDDGTCGCCQ